MARYTNLYLLLISGSSQQGLRVCTSFVEDCQYALLDEQMALFEENHPR